MPLGAREPPMPSPMARQAPPAAPNDPFVRHFNDQGVPFWVNERTHESTWVEPAKLMPLGAREPPMPSPMAHQAPPAPPAAPNDPWVRHFNDQGVPFWFNEWTHESTWVEPAKLMPVGAREPPMLSPRAHQAPPAATNGPWVRHFNDQGVPFCFNGSSHQSTWVPTVSLIGNPSQATIMQGPMAHNQRRNAAESEHATRWGVFQKMMVMDGLMQVGMGHLDIDGR
jgi:hypothetical protein